ncbi:MAG: FecR family protein [Acidobacteriota bacterium]
MKLISALTLIFLLMAGSEFTFAQNETLRAAAGDKWMISARAGGVNYVEGDVAVVRSNARSGRLLKGDMVEIGDRVSTGTSGKAEILMNPGSYIRLAGNSAFEFITTDLDDLRIKLDRGSAILEIFASKDFKVVVQTPRLPLSFDSTGVYRIDIENDGSARLEVWKGKARIGNTTLKAGKSAVITPNGPEFAKFDRDEKDDFELWSQSRARDLAKIVGDLQNKSLRPVLLNSYLAGDWNIYTSFGLWIYNPRFASYCFFPFGYGWSSPYGYSLPSSMWWYRMTQYILWRDQTMPGSVNTGGSGTTTTGTGQAPPTVPRPPDQESRYKRPPFIDMQGSPSGSPPIIEFPGAETRGTAGAPGKAGSPAPPVFSPPPAPSAPTTIPMDRQGPVRVKGDN